MKPEVTAAGNIVARTSQHPQCWLNKQGRMISSRVVEM